MRDLSLHLLDIARNSITANSTEINIMINEDCNNDFLTMSIQDNGIGMNQMTLD
ncbi:MAG: ATP-binding protein, partial [Desulfurococcales archaeon]|nr:ATP-binding protein [Desulfurococcales archaeon]